MKGGSPIVPRMPERTTKRKAAAPAAEKKPPRKTVAGPQEFAIETAQLLADDKCRDVVVLDVRTLSQLSDFIVIGTGSSERQMVRRLSCRTVVRPFKQFETLRWFLTHGFHLLERPVGGREFCHQLLHATLRPVPVPR